MTMRMSAWGCGRPMMRCLVTLLLAASAATAGAREVVLVAGATGGTGRALVEQLVRNRRYEVRALARDVTRASAVLPPGTIVVSGDVRDPATLAAPMTGVTYVISAIGAGFTADPTNDARAVDHLGVRNLAIAAQRAGVRRFVLVSATDVTRAAAHPVAALRPILAAKLDGEAELRASGVPYTIVRPGGLSSDAGGVARVEFAQGDTLDGRRGIARADVAAVCIATLRSSHARGRTFEIVRAEGAWNGPFFRRELRGLQSDARMSPSSK